MQTIQSQDENPPKIIEPSAPVTSRNAPKRQAKSRREFLKPPSRGTSSPEALASKHKRIVVTKQEPRSTKVFKPGHLSYNKRKQKSEKISPQRDPNDDPFLVVENSGLPRTRNQEYLIEVNDDPVNYGMTQAVPLAHWCSGQVVKRVSVKPGSQKTNFLKKLEHGVFRVGGTAPRGEEDEDQPATLP